MATDVMSDGLPPVPIQSPLVLRTGCVAVPLTSGFSFLGSSLGEMIRKVLVHHCLFFTRLFRFPRKEALHLFGPLSSQRVPCCSSFQNGVGFGYCWWRGSLGPHHSSGGCLSVCLWRCFPALPGLCCERSSDCFTLLPFGLSVAPWAFTCVIRPLEGICYRWGQLLYSYLDPFFHLDSNHGVLGYASPSESVPVSWVTSRCWEVPPDSFPLLVCLSVLFHLDSALSPSGLHGPFHLPLDVSHHMSCHGLDFRPAPSTVPPSPSLWGSFASVPWWLGCPSSPLLFPGMFLTPLDHWTLSVWLEVDFLVRLSLCPCLFWLCGS